MKVHWSRSLQHHGMRVTLAVVASAGMLATFALPGNAAVAPVSQSSAQSVNIDLLSTTVDATTTATTAHSDGTSDELTHASPDITILPANGFLGAGALSQVSAANADHSSYACSGVLSAGGAIQIGDGGTSCSAIGGGRGGVTLDLAKIPGVGGPLNALASVTLTADALTAHAYRDGVASPTGKGLITGLVAHVTLVGGALGTLNLPVTLAGTPNENLLTAVVNALNQYIAGHVGSGLLLGALVDLLSNGLSGIVSLKTNYQTTLSGGAFKVSALHVSLLTNTAAVADVASATVGPNQGPTVPSAAIKLKASPGDKLVSLTWTKPASDGGEPILGYNLYRGTKAGGESVTPVNGKTLIKGLGYQDVGLSNGTTYYYVVKAVNRIGESATSNEAHATPSASACPSPFDDVPSTSTFCQDIRWMKTNGITKGVTKTLYKPLWPTTRDQMAGFVYRQLNAGKGDATCTKKPFDDVSIDQEFCGDIAWLKDKKIVKGYPGNKFRPGQPVLRQEVAAFMFRMHHIGQPDPGCSTAPFNDVPTSNIFCGDITWMSDNGISYGNTAGDFLPRDTTLRQEMAALVHRMVTILG